ncbi:MAG: hypothetical protein ACOY81_02165 [Bacillota bacterium]
MVRSLWPYLASTMGFAVAAWLALRPEPDKTVTQRLKVARRRVFGDPNSPEQIEKARKWALKLRYAGMNEIHIRLACIACAVLFFAVYLFFSRSLVVAMLYVVFGWQIPLLVVDVAAMANESKGFGQIADMISAFTDARELKMTVGSALSAAGRAVSGPPLGDDITRCLRSISLDASRDHDILRLLGREIGNPHLVNFADLIQQVKKSGVEDPRPFRMLDWVIQEEDKLQEELRQAIMSYMVFLAIFSLANLMAIPVLYFSLRDLWATLVGMPVLMYIAAGSALLMMKGIRDYATKRVLI